MGDLEDAVTFGGGAGCRAPEQSPCVFSAAPFGFGDFGFTGSRSSAAGKVSGRLMAVLGRVSVILSTSFSIPPDLLELLLSPRRQPPSDQSHPSRYRLCPWKECREIEKKKNNHHN